MRGIFLRGTVPERGAAAGADLSRADLDGADADLSACQPPPAVAPGVPARDLAADPAYKCRSQVSPVAPLKAGKQSTLASAIAVRNVGQCA